MNDNQSIYEFEYGGWRFIESTTFIPRDIQWRNYFDEKFSNISIDMQEIRQVMDEALQEDLDPKFAEVHEHIEQTEEYVSTIIEEVKNDVETATTATETNISEAKEEIIEKIESVDIENVVNCAKIEIKETIEEAKEHLCCDICHAKEQIIRHIDEKLSDLNQQVIEEANNA